MDTITIPKNLMKKGDLVIIPRKEYEGLLDFKKAISKDQSWFWTKEWQKKEKEADDDIKAGRVSGPFDNAKDLIKHLNGLKKRNV